MCSIAGRTTVKLHDFVRAKLTLLDDSESKLAEDSFRANVASAAASIRDCVRLATLSDVDGIDIQQRIESCVHFEPDHVSTITKAIQVRIRASDAEKYKCKGANTNGESNFQTMRRPDRFMWKDTWVMVQNHDKVNAYKSMARLACLIGLTSPRRKDQGSDGPDRTSQC